jgi:DNA polymerase/3'-5' exonuclease PolX
MRYISKINENVSCPSYEYPIIITDNLNNDLNNITSISKLENIPGFSKRIVRKYIESGIRFLDIPKKNPLTSLQKIGWIYRDKFNLELSYDNVSEIWNEIFVKFFKKIGVKKFYICGSYRRKTVIMKDIDILIILPDLSESDSISNSIIQKLKIYIDKLYIGKNKFSFIISGKSGDVIQIDIRYFLPIHHASALLHFTGSKEFNIHCRKKAINLGYKLNEYGLFDTKTNKHIYLDGEKKILDFIGVNKKYYDPKCRTMDVC